VLETEAHPAIPHDVIPCNKRSSMLIQDHSTTFVLSAADDGGKV
jgi:hypothetical protein